MSVMERRLQLLLDQARYDVVEAEAKRTGRSVAAVIREAIDYRFNEDVDARRGAGERLLSRTATPDGVEPDWADSKAVLMEDLGRGLT
jgi:predicted DNA-binding protein